MNRSRVATRTLMVLSYFGAVSAMAGGILGVVANGAGVPLSYLDGTPFDSFVVPGLILGVVVGGTQLASAIAIRRRGQRGLLASVIAGFGMLIWIVAELAFIGEYSWLQSVYFALGVLELLLVFLLLGLFPSVVQPDSAAQLHPDRIRQQRT